MLANEPLECEGTLFQIIVQIHIRVLLNEIVETRQVHFELIRGTKLRYYLLELLFIFVSWSSLGRRSSVGDISGSIS